MNDIEKLDKLLEACRSLDSDNEVSDILSLFGKYFELVQGIALVKNKNVFTQIASYAFISDEKIVIEAGDGLVGQVARDKKIYMISNISENYFTVISGLGKTSKLQLVIVPFIKNNNVEVILEMAFFKLPDKKIVENFTKIGDCFFNILKKKRS